MIFRLSSNIKIGFRLSKYHIRTQSECQNRILNVKLRYSASVRISKNVKRKAKNEKRKAKSEKRKTKTRYSASIQMCECQNRILNVKLRYSASVRISQKRKTKTEKRKPKNENRKPNQLHLPCLSVVRSSLVRRVYFVYKISQNVFELGL